MAHHILAIHKRQSHFYGWRIVALGFINNFCAAGFGTYAFSVLIKPMADDASLGWSRTQLVWGVTIAVIVTTATGPLIGLLVDKKHGARLLMVGVGLVGGLGIALLSQVHHLWQYYLLFGVLAAFMHYTPVFLVVPTIVSKWFIRKRGRALILSTMGRPLSGILLLPITEALVTGVGWRSTWLILGSVSAALIVPFNALFLRRSPEDLGLTPDGDAPRAQKDRPQEGLQGEEASWTLASAMRTAPFWLVLLATNLGIAGLIGVLINQVAYLQENFSGGVAVTGATLLTVVSFTSRGLWLLIADRFNPQYPAAATFICSALGMLFFIFAGNIPMMVLWSIAFGLGIAGMDPLTSQVWANYFGRSFLGSIRGFVALTNVVSFAGSPLMVAAISDSTGSYEIAFLIFLVGFSVAAISMFMAGPPRLPKPKQALSLKVGG